MREDATSRVVGIATALLFLAVPLLAQGPVVPAPDAVTVAQGAESDRPIDVGLAEEVDVRLVLVDFLVLDRRGHTVPDLTSDEIFVLVDGRKQEIASLDVDCPIGEAADPLPGRKSEPLPVPPAARPPRIVLVFDYFHMDNTAETFDNVTQALDKWTNGGEEHMVISLGQVIRVEAPFTSDVDEIRWTLARMRNDPELYAANYSRLTERRFFQRVHTLFDLLETWEGRKTVVLFSGPLIPDGFTHDPEYRALSGLSTTVRASIYPVDTGGLRTPSDPRYSPLGGPLGLRRLANETGGRMTDGTNEIGLAYAKAHRDSSCTYTVGFYDRRARFDDERRISLRLKKRRGRRIIYPEFYMIRSEEAKRKSLFRSAAMAPQFFESSGVAADLFVMSPHSSERWKALLAVEVRLPPDTVLPEDEEWELRALIRKTNGTVVRSLRRRVTLPAPELPGAPPPVVTMFEEIRVRPGKYLVSAVLSNPDAESPLAATRSAVVSSIPLGKPFMIGPMLGNRPVTDGATQAARSLHAFEPLLDQEASRGATLDSLTVVCVVDPDHPVELSALGREVVSWEGDARQHFDPVTTTLAGGRTALECHHQFDRVETARLNPGRYELNATAETEDYVAGSGSVEFTILEAAAK